MKPLLLFLILSFAIACQSEKEESSAYETTTLVDYKVMIDYADQKLLQPGQLVISEEPERIVVADNGDNLLKLFNPEGELIDEFGTEGSGPGEFMAINSLHYFKDALYAYDEGLSRFSKFDLEGGYVDSYPLQTGELPFTYHTVFEGKLVTSTAGAGESLVATFTKDGTPEDTLGRSHSPVAEMGPIMTEIPQQAENRQVPDYFTNIANLISNDDYLWAAMTAYPKLYRIDSSWQMDSFSFEVERAELIEDYYFEQQSGTGPVLNMQYISDLAVTDQYLYVLNTVNFTEDYAAVIYQVNHEGHIENRYKLPEHTGHSYRIAANQDDEHVYVINQDEASLIRYDLHQP